jgi:hypothetical protein
MDPFPGPGSRRARLQRGMIRAERLVLRFEARQFRVGFIFSPDEVIVGRFDRPNQFIQLQMGLGSCGLVAL